jgi:hypothetical protein
MGNASIQRRNRNVRRDVLPRARGLVGNFLSAVERAADHPN